VRTNNTLDTVGKQVMCKYVESHEIPMAIDIWWTRAYEESVVKTNHKGFDATVAPDNKH
jgi:hypothetical protein